MVSLLIPVGVLLLLAESAHLLTLRSPLFALRLPIKRRLPSSTVPSLGLLSLRLARLTLGLPLLHPLLALSLPLLHSLLPFAVVLHSLSLPSFKFGMALLHFLPHLLLCLLPTTATLPTAFLPFRTLLALHLPVLAASATAIVIVPAAMLAVALTLALRSTADRAKQQNHCQAQSSKNVRSKVFSSHKPPRSPIQLIFIYATRIPTTI
ncbi:MAG: hypothetical protein ABR535_02510 [Pyrinomonadaceae bacterium]